MKPIRAHVAAALSVLAASLTGCQGTGKAINSGTGIVDIKVWCVLSSIFDVEVGDRGNVGCRLTEEEMRDRIAALQKNASIFGAGTVFRWSPSDINVVFDPGFSSRSDQRLQDWISFAHFSASAPQNVINVWFTGNVQNLSGVTSRVWAWTLDPAAAAGLQPFPPRPWIIVNDGGFVRAFGFEPPPLNGDPSAVIGYHILEHEMDHYLGRFTSRAFPSTGSTYDPGEHDTFAPQNMIFNRFNVLRDGGTGQGAPYKLVVPLIDQSGERAEVRQRVRAGAWNLP